MSYMCNRVGYLISWVYGYRMYNWVFINKCADILLNEQIRIRSRFVVVDHQPCLVTISRLPLIIIGELIQISNKCTPKIF